MREHFVAPVGAARDDGRRVHLRRELPKGIAPRLGRVVAELVVPHVEDRVDTADGERRAGSDDDRRDQSIGQERARERDRLQCYLVDGSPIVIDEHEHRPGRTSHPSPSS